MRSLALSKDWKLSPAYDLTPSSPPSEEQRDLALVCGDEGRYANARNLLTQCERFHMKRDEAIALMAEMEQSVARRAGTSPPALAGSVSKIANGFPGPLPTRDFELDGRLSREPARDLWDREQVGHGCTLGDQSAALSVGGIWSRGLRPTEVATTLSGQCSRKSSSFSPPPVSISNHGRRAPHELSGAVQYDQGTRSPVRPGHQDTRSPTPGRASALPAAMSLMSSSLSMAAGQPRLQTGCPISIPGLLVHFGAKAEAADHVIRSLRRKGWLERASWGQIPP